jgi:hypothetical protein
MHLIWHRPCRAAGSSTSGRRPDLGP